MRARGRTPVGRWATTSVPAPLRYRDFALLWSGQTVSVAGDGIFTVALAVQSLRVDRSPVVLAVVFAARLLPTVVLVLLGGIVVDRVPRRLAMLASDLARGLAVAAIAALTATGVLTVGELVGMSVAFGVADAFFYPASTAIVPELLSDALLVPASALSSLSRVIAQQLIGPAIGGVIVASVGTAASFAFDAVSFTVSAACLLAISTQPRAVGSARSMLGEVREGLTYVRSQPWLWLSIAVAGLGNFAIFSPLGVLIPLLIRHVFHDGAAALGLTLAAGGAGGVIAVLAVNRRGVPDRPMLAIVGVWTAGGLAGGAIGLSPGAWAAAPLYAATSALVMYGNALWTPLMQRIVPRRLLGRASSVDWLVSIALTPLGIVAAGAIAAGAGVRTTILAGGAAAGLAGCALLHPGIREAGHGQPHASDSVRSHS